MGFRTLEISYAAEIHIKEGQLEITTDDGVAVVPIEDLNQIMVHGANIRLSTMDLSILSQNKVALMTLDDRYLPTAIVSAMTQIQPQGNPYLKLMDLTNAIVLADGKVFKQEKGYDTYHCIIAFLNNNKQN